MAYLFLPSAVLCSALLSIMASLFNKRNSAYQGFSMLYNFILIGSACGGWCIIYLTNLSFDAGVLPYSLAYAIGYAMALICLFKALECGPVSLTALLKSISLVLPSVWGFFFWDDPLTLPVILGFVLVLVSLILFFAKKREKGQAEIPLKWFLYILGLLIGNGGSLTIQKYQQIAFEGAHKNMLMFFATAVAALVCLVFALIDRKKNTLTRKALARSFYLPAAAGLGSTLFNLLLMITLPLLPSSVIYPAIAVGSVIVTTLFSALVCKERLRTLQWLGLLVGCVALALLNL